MQTDAQFDCCETQNDLPDLEERERSVLAELARECDGTVAFQGLRRRLGIHQQILTRTLSRLAEAGLVSRDEHGYRATERGCAVVRACGPGARENAQAPLVVAEALLPPHVGGEELAARLAHRWFGGLRWYGLSHGPGETTLTWIVDGEGTLVRLRVANGSFQLATEGASASSRTFQAAHAVLSAVTDLYGMEREAPPVATFGFGSFAA